MQRKAQAATELLFTYGWAFLVLLAIIGAFVYFGVSNPKKSVPLVCLFPAGTPCLEQPVLDATNDKIRFALKNSLVKKINITDYVKVSVGCNMASLSKINNLEPPQVIDNNENMIIEVDCPGLEPGGLRTDVTLRYISQDTGIQHTVTGIVSGVAS